MKAVIWNLTLVNELRREPAHRKTVITGLINSAIAGGTGDYVVRDGKRMVVTYEHLNVVVLEDDDAFYVTSAFWRYD